MKKGFLFALLIITLCVTTSFFSCSGEESAAAAASARPRIAVSMPPADNAWQARMFELLNDTVAKYPDIEWTVTNAVNNNDQENQLNIMMNDMPDIIVILPGDGTLLRATCERIYDAGIRTVIFDRPISPSTKYTAMVVGDNYAGGVNAGHYIAGKLDGNGDVAVLRSYVGTPIDLDRFNGFNDTITAHYPGIRIIVQGDGEFNMNAGFTAMTNILPGYPRIDAVYAQDDETALGALNAIMNAARTDIQFITGFGGKRDAYLRFLDNDPVYVASMSYLPILGIEAIELAMKVHRGEHFEKDNILPSVVVDSSNAAEFMQFAY